MSMYWATSDIKSDFSLASYLFKMLYYVLLLLCAGALANEDKTLGMS